MMKFCDFLDQQKEYKLADTILGKFQKTAMVKTYHSNNISFDKILDLSCKYIEANPNSLFVKTAGPPDQGPSYNDIYKFLRRIGFTDNDFKRDISIEIVKQKYRMYTRDLKYPPTATDTKLYDTVLRTGFDKPNGVRVITPDLRIKLNAIAGLDNITPGSTTQSGSKEPPASSSGSSSKSSPSDTQSNVGSGRKKGPDAVGAAAESGAASEQAKRKLLYNFFIKLKDLFPKFSSQLGGIANSISSWGGPLVAACFLIPSATYWVNSIVTQHWEALDSPTEAASFGSFLSALGGTIAAVLGLISAAPTAGEGLVAGGGLAAVLYTISGLLSMGSFVSSFFDNDDPTDKLPKAKPTTKPAPQSGSSTKPTSTTTSKPTSQTPQTPQPVKPPKKAPRTTFNPASGLGFD